jgi:hypothetical protein
MFALYSDHLTEDQLKEFFDMKDDPLIGEVWGKVDPLTGEVWEKVDDIRIQTAIKEAREKYLKIGFERGYKIGYEKGKKIGIMKERQAVRQAVHQAVHQEKNLTAISFLRHGVPREAIQAAMNMTERELLALEKKLESEKS